MFFSVLFFFVYESTTTSQAWTSNLRPPYSTMIVITTISLCMLSSSQTTFNTWVAQHLISAYTSTFTMSINSLSINAKGLNHPVKRSFFWAKALKHHSKILCMQETHFHQLAPPKCTHASFPHIFSASIPTKTRGVLITICDTTAFLLVKQFIDPGGRFVILICDLNSTRYTVSSIATIKIYCRGKHLIKI